MPKSVRTNQSAPMQNANSSGVLAATNLSATLRSHSAILAVPVRRVVAFFPGELSGFLFALPALHALRESFPGARICAVLRPSLASFLRDSPLCDEVWERAKGGLSRQTSLMLQLRAWQPDLAVAFSRSRITTLLAWSSGAEERIGYEGARLESLLTQSVWCENFNSPEAPLSLARALGCRTEKTDANGLLSLSARHDAQAAKLLDSYGIGAEFMVAMPDLSTQNAPLFSLENANETPNNLAIEYSIIGLSSAIEQGGRAAERALHAGVQAVRNNASRKIGARHNSAPNAQNAKDSSQSNGNADAENAEKIVAEAAFSESESDDWNAENSVEFNERNRRSLRAVSLSASQWAHALNGLSARAPVLLVGAKPATAIVERIAQLGKNDEVSRANFPVIDLGGELELAVIAAILRRASLFVGADSGILHLAAAVETPIVGLWNANQRYRQPRGVTFRSISETEIRGENEMEIAKRVVAAAHEIIGI